MDDEINLRDYIEVIKKRWKMIACITIGLAAVALIFSLFQKPIYEAKTTIIIRGNQSSFSQFAGLASLAGINLPSGRDNIYDLAGIFRSQAVAEKVIADLKLRERVEEWNDPGISHQKLVETVKNLVDKPKSDGNLIELTVEFNDPELAAEIANGFCDALSHHWNKLNYTEARKKREYIESQLPGIEKDLKKAEQKIKKFTMLSPVGMRSGSNLLGAVTGSQFQGIEVSRLLRELEIQNAVYIMLRKEYEAVKLEESKEIPPFSIVDKAVPPEKPSKPRKKLNTLVGFMLGMFLGMFVAFFREYWEKTGNN